MWKYLGSKFTAYAAVMVPLFILAPIPFGLSVLCSEISGATLFIALGCAACTVIWGIYAWRIRNQLYSWGCFQRDGIRVKTLFSKDSTIMYEKCKGCGIGFYVHGVLNSNAGTKVRFIFFSYDAFDESYRSHMNLWKPSETRIKVAFSKKLYNYLIDVLPARQSLSLRRDYQKYLGGIS